MIIYKTFKFRLCPNEKQSIMLHQHGGNVRFMWNKLVEFANQYKDQNGKFPLKKILRNQGIQIKKDNEFIKISHSQPMQVEVDRLSDTIIKSQKSENVSKRNQKVAKAKTEKDAKKQEKKLNKALQFAMPKFKSRHDQNDSIFYPQNFKIRKSKIFFAKMDWINFVKHRPIKGKPKTISINQEGELWFVSITCEIKVKDQVMKPLGQANIVGVDVGLTKFATLSDGSEIQNPRTLQKNIKKLRKEQKILSNKLLIETDKKTFYGKPIKQSSKRRDKQIAKVQKVYRKCRNIRKDFLHRISHHLITKYDGIILETLDIQNMLRDNSRAMNRSILDVSWYAFGEMLNYKAKWNNKYFTKIDTFDPSTQTCNQCKDKMKLSLEERTYLCPKCGYICGRDKNAALNIKDSGMKILEDKYNTIATMEIEARGSTPLGVGMKREKLRDKKQPMAAT